MTALVVATSGIKQRDQAQHGEQDEVAWGQRAFQLSPDP
jgi:hypothetical protein